MWLVWLLTVLGAYLLGSLPTAYLVVKWRTGQDIRTVGSGNMGATNAVRCVGPLGYAVFAVDLLKGLLPVVIGRALIGDPLAAAAGLAALLGHFFPLWLGFKGGKGASTAVGIYLGLCPWVGLFGLLFWFVVNLATGYVSFASTLTLALGPFAALFFHISFPVFWLLMMTGLLVSLRHLPNFRRLLAGNERRSKIYYKKLLKKL